METVIQDHTPLADYLKGQPALSSFLLTASRLRQMAPRTLTTLVTTDEGEGHQAWPTPPVSDNQDESPPDSPSFAPVGRPMVKKRFRAKLPDPLPLNIPRMDGLKSLRNSYSVRHFSCRIAARHENRRLTV
jgi:hypothetical protein